MNIPVYNNITTPESLGATIRNDDQVSTWFSLLLKAPLARDFLTARDNVTQGTYERFSGLIRLQAGMTGLLGGLLLAAWIFPHEYIWGAGALLLFLGILSVRRQKTTVIEKLALIFVLNNFDRQALGRQTLYQITEFYAREYRIPSLVEAINIFTRAAQDTAFTFLAITLLLIPFPSFSWERAFVLILGYPFARNALFAYILKKKTIGKTSRPPGHPR
ncbi:MAG TPA: hypothetical protein PLB05_02865 [Candidatus Omnitrophota bacterium]|nr:hypothetical protein [Candidatus Omnitrophota bacterium]HPN56257.1 hypothetical protein [Candidatus Omnitrophota bacterium]